MKFIITIFICSITVYLNAQNPVHRVLNNITGLPSNAVYNIIQDNKGFIWVSHDKGLSRYDGKQIINYKNKSPQSKSLSNLLEINNEIYCQDFAGYYYKTNTNLELEKITFSTPSSFNAVGFINKKLVSIKYDSIRTFNLNTKKYSAYYVNTKNQYANYFSNKEVYFINENQVYVFNDSQINPVIKFSETKAVFYFLLNLNNTFYAITRNTYPYIHQLGNQTIKTFPYLPKGTFVQNVCEFNNEIWICTSKGAYCFDKNFVPKFKGVCFFNDNSISKVIQDKEGNYWFSTLTNGLLIVPNIYSKLFTINNESFSAIVNNKEDILVGSISNSILKFNSSSKKFTTIFKRTNNHEILDIFLDNENKVFVSSDQLSVLNNNSSTNYQIASKSTTQITDNLFAIAYSTDIGIINTKENLNLNEIPKWLTNSNAVLEKNIYNLNINKGRCRDVLYHAPTKTLYAATASGLFYFSPNGNGEITYQSKPIFASHLTSNENTLFAGTFIQNVFAIDTNKKSQQLYITNNDIYKIHNYSNFLFLVADDGLIQYNLQTKQKRIFTNADGLPKAEIKDVIVKNNILYIATSLGLVYLDIDTKKVNDISPTINVNEVLANGEKINWHNEISLAPNKNNISIHFSALSFKSQDGITVTYKINNEPWQNVDANSRIINLPALSSGKYKLNIKAINEDGIEAQQPTTLTFTIKTPLYKQWWFFSFLVFLACLILYLYFKRRLQSEHVKNNLIAQKMQLEKELQQSILTSIKSQMNPHFLFNALNTVQSYIYTNEKENATKYLGKFSELTRMILEMSNKPSVTIATEIKALQLYLDLEKQRFEEKLNYEFNCDRNINAETSYIPSMLIQPYIENAIKHGLMHSKNKWLLSINFTKVEKGILVVIEDNGIGRKKSIEFQKHKNLKHQSFSTTANKKRLEILNQGFNNNISVEIIDKEDVFGHSLGTKVLLNIPFVSSHS